MNVNRIWIATLALALAAGCKQGLGERCEVDSDCSSGVCAMASPKTCMSANQQTDQIDAMVPIDAPPAPDAPPDARIDAP